MTGFIQTVVLGLLTGGVYALAASGLTLVFGVMNVINVAHGALLILSAYLTWLIWRETGLDPLVIALLTTPMMFALGWVIYWFAVRRVRGVGASTTVLLTFAVALIIEGALGRIWKGVFRAVTPSYFNEAITIGDIRLPTAKVYACAVAVALLVLLWLLLAKTWVGRAIRASSENVNAARRYSESLWLEKRFFRIRFEKKPTPRRFASAYPTYRMAAVGPWRDP